MAELQIATAARLWTLGLLESLQLHRCVVLLVLDSSKTLWSRVWRCLLLSGCLFLGTILWWALALGPATRWLTSLAEPCYGPAWAGRAQQTLAAAFDVLLLLPVYAVTLLASSAECQSVAEAAFAVRLQGRSAGPAVSGRDAATETQSKGIPQPGSGRCGGSSLESAAQDLYRVLLLSVYYLEVWALGKVPYVGRPLYMVSMTWLWAYYCFDYKWQLQAVPLAERLAYFETHWAFFSGFGAVQSAATVMLPFYWGAAMSAVLFPLFIIVACDSSPDKVHAAAAAAAALRQGQARGQAPWGQRRLPIFCLALWPCQQLLGLLRAT